MRIANYFILALAVAQLCCSRKPQDLIVGEWTRTALQREQPGLFYPTSLQFFTEGTVNVAGKPLRTSVAGNYRFLDDNSVRMDIQGIAPIILKVQVSSEELLLTFPAGEIAKYRKGDFLSSKQTEPLDKPKEVASPKSGSGLVGTYSTTSGEPSTLRMNADGTYIVDGRYRYLWGTRSTTWKLEGTTLWLLQQSPPNVPLEIRGDTLEFPLDNDAVFVRKR